MYHYKTYWYFGVYKKACLSLHFYKKKSLLIYYNIYHPGYYNILTTQVVHPLPPSR